MAKLSMVEMSWPKRPWPKCPSNDVDHGDHNDEDEEYLSSAIGINC